MSKSELIEFLRAKSTEIEDYKMTKESVQSIVDFGLDVINKSKEIGVKTTSDFYQSIDLFQNLLNEDFKGDDEKFFNGSKEDLIMDISLFISKLER